MYKSKIFLVGEGEGHLVALEETSYVNEGTLQELLVEYPDLLPGDQIDPENPRRWILVARELGVPGGETETGRWSLDHLFLDQDGIPTFVECKRAEDTRARREVVAQMLDYAANGTQYWSMDRLRQAAAETAQAQGKSLDEEITALLDGSEDEVDIEEYWELVESNLRKRRVRLVFVADSTPRELRRLVEFLNEEMTNVEVLAVEVKQFQRNDDPGQKALVPRVVGLTETARSTKGTSSTGRKQWTEGEFFQILGQSTGPGIVSIVKDLYEWSQDVADRIWFGTGRETGSFTFHYLREGRTVSVFTIYTNGKLMLNYGWLSDQVDRTIVEEFHRRIHEMPTLRHIPGDLSKWPTTEVADAFKDPEAIEQFKQIVQWLGEEVDTSKLIPRSA